MDSPDFPRLSLADVLNMTVEDVMDNSDFDLDHLNQEERDQCLDRIRLLINQGKQYREDQREDQSEDQSEDESEDEREDQRDYQREIAVSTPVDAKELAKRLSKIPPRRRAPPSPIIPAPCSLCLTPTAPSSPTQVDLLREKKAYEALVQDGCQPSHPLELGFEVLDKPGEYENIISYWRTISESGQMLFLTQLKNWESFRYWQDEVRQYYAPRNDFSDFQQKVNERRQRHNLKGKANLLLERTKQSRLDNWMEYQNYHLHSLEKLEVAIQNAKEVLETAKRKFGEAGGPALEDALEQSDLDISLRSRQRYRSQYFDTWKEWQFAVLKRKLWEAQLKEADQNDRIQKKAASAKRRERNLRKSENRLRFRERVVEAARELEIIEVDLRREKILLEWIDQQHSIIASEGPAFIHDTEGNHNDGLAKQARSRDPENNSGSDLVASRTQKPGLTCSGRIHESEVPKPTATKRALSPQMRTVSRKNHWSTRSARALAPRRSKRIAGLQGNGRLRGNVSSGANHGQSVEVSLRRSTRVSKKPERFCPG